MVGDSFRQNGAMPKSIAPYGLLKSVVVEDDDYRTVFWAMKKISERSGHDMAMGKAASAPTPADLKADLQELNSHR